MKRQTYAYATLVAALLLAPACGQSGDPSGADNRRDRVATERANEQTNETAPDPTRQPDRSADSRDGTTGTSGAVRRSAEEAMGVGPDATITMRVQAEYASADVVKGRNIDVDTDNGVVTLTGSVDSAREKQEAERIAREVDGVRRVVNRLTIETAR
ncbi:MAG: BON domain-containing protein [Vicinamibacterales bacterium]